MTHSWLSIVMKNSSCGSCCNNYSPEWHLWYADFSKALSRLSSSGDYKRTWQGVLAVLILYIYYKLLVHATTIITCPYVHTSFSCPITHLHVFFLRPPYFLHVPWHHTLNLYCTCAYHVYTIVIRRECGQTLTRVRVSWTYISIIIISLQWMESTWPGSHVIESRAVWKNLGSRRIGKSLEKALGLGVTSRDMGSSWCTHGVHMYSGD